MFHQTTRFNDRGTGSFEDLDQAYSSSSSSQHSTLINSPAGSQDHGFDDADHSSSSQAGTSLVKVVRRPSFLDNDEQPSSAATAAVTSPNSNPKSKVGPVTWRSLPNKGQLAIITLARLSEPLAERSLAAYMFYQLRSFDPSLPDSTITSQGGMLTAAFAGAQFLTSVWWGRAADSPRIGRKRVLLVGLFGTALASIGVGFSKTFTQALCFRALAGALNGNIGVMRTMISEIILEKKFQSRAFLLLPMCFNIGVVIGPILGGFMADPISSFPGIFGPGSWLGGKDGVAWMREFPYGLPNLFSGIFITMSALCIVLGLDETHQALRNKPDYGRKIGKWIVRVICRRQKKFAYSRLSNDETELEESSSFPNPHSKSDVEDNPTSSTSPTPTLFKPQSSTRSPFLRILTSNVLMTLLSHHLLAFHISAFNALIFLFLPSPQSPPPKHFTIRFTGGLGLTSSNVGLATAVMGIIGFPLQILIYPPLNARLGTLRGYRLFLPFSALAYAILPFLALVATKSWLVWPGLVVVLGMQVLSRTFALTSTVILINNSSPAPEVLGTIHGVAQSVSSAARMLGPTVGGWALGLGLKEKLVGGVWWAMAAMVGLNWALLWCVYEGDGSGGRA